MTTTQTSTLPAIDATHDSALQSWVMSANGHPQFPIQNLPLGVFDAGEGARIGTAIGNEVLDLAAALEWGLLPTLDMATEAALHSDTLNAWMALSAAQRSLLRAALSDLLQAQTASGRQASAFARQLLRPQDACRMLLPADVGDYSDFYAGIHHAVNAGRIFRPDNPLLPNYKHVPIAYHGRSSSIRPSGTPLQRPIGQIRRDTPEGPAPELGPTERLDYELELAIWVGAGNPLGTQIPIEQASAHIAGFGLFNDWSARDLQAWEYQPLGPFTGKNFMSSVSPWVVTQEALAPFRGPAMARAEGDPRPLPYLNHEDDQRNGGLRIQLEVLLSTASMREQGLAPHRLSIGDSSHLYWTPAQMLTQQTIGGCNARAGDLLGSGTISAPTPDGYGALLEITEGGKKPVQLANGETRTFLQDGDEIIFRGWCEREGFARIGLGECRGRVQG
ncbi:fumarylacetoacetase [Diaphorobacter ruginosibacter]|uniref:fumarylacetoacetase n=1 Tax=Diaphorobacter ruginosibacter TaxID=1715720 RepID=A0A7G9RNX6_9BURK|nr:fumarylacetoacetase [Diaphorobacter ruginosibacter]QNN57301.1 fumarylacetoacetase [Diaphorobacter ruginosibacter]